MDRHFPVKTIFPGRTRAPTIGSVRIESVDSYIFARLRLVADLGYPICSPVMQMIPESQHHLYNPVGHDTATTGAVANYRANRTETDGLNATIDISEITQRCWAEITSLMQITNERLFPSKARTRELIRSGEYLNHLKDFQPLLRGWLDNFEVLERECATRVIRVLRLSDCIQYPSIRDCYSLSSMNTCVRSPLDSQLDGFLNRVTIGIYVNSLALQAVLEQWTSTHQAGSRPYAGATNGPNARTPSALLSPSLVELYKGNEYYIKEVVDASRNLLRNVVEGLLPNDGLKHTPVRTYFRIFSGAMFLLKVSPYTA